MPSRRTVGTSDPGFPVYRTRGPSPAGGGFGTIRPDIGDPRTMRGAQHEFRTFLNSEPVSAREKGGRGSRRAVLAGSRLVSKARSQKKQDLEPSHRSSCALDVTVHRPSPARTSPSTNPKSGRSGRRWPADTGTPRLGALAGFFSGLDERHHDIVILRPCSGSN